MLKIEVVSREDLSRVIERKFIDRHSYSLHDLLTAECPEYRPEIKPYLSAYVDGVKFPQEIWKHVDLSSARTVRFVIEAGGIEVSTVMAIISVVMAVGTAVYAIIMANRLTSATQGDSKQGSSIYDVNAQGNKTALTKVVPENFGFFKHFPDYLADKHVFYRNNKQFIDMILCQGVGYYQHANDNSDIYVGETPIKELEGCLVSIFDPGTEITAENSIEDKCWYCYYSSTEVTASGHTLEPAVTEVDQSSQQNPQAYFVDDSFSSFYYVGGGTTYNGCTGPQQNAPVRKTLNLGWGQGAYFTISGANNTRLVGLSDVITDDAVTGTSEIEVTLADNFTGNNFEQHKQWFRERSIDPETSDTIAGDMVKVLIKKISRVTFTQMGGTSGPKIQTVENSNEVTSVCELLAVTYTTSGDDEIATITLDTAEITQEPYPNYPAVPGGAYDVSREQTMEVTILQGIPADYPYADNGMYVINSHDSDTGVYVVSRVNSSYSVLPDWSEFWGQGVPQTSLSFTLDESSSTAGEYVGPYRACPYGASSTIFEYDISFPQGLGYLQDDGTFRDLSVEIEIGYRIAGSNDPWTTTTRTFTNHTNDQLAFTYQLEIETAGNYEFRMKNLTEADNNTRVLNTCKWIGLKSVVSTCNKYDGMTVIIGRFKGTETLSEISENQIATYWTRKLPNISTGDMEATTDVAPVVKYICNKSKYAGIIDDVSLAAYDQWWKSKEITLNGTVDSDSTLLEVLRDCLNVGFASPVVMNDKLSFTKLHIQGVDEPLSQIFTPQNLTKSPEITFNLPKDDDVDEVVVEYTSPQTYKTETIYCHVDENGDKNITTYPLSVNQEKLTAFGVTRSEQAEVMGMRRLRYLRSTRVTYEIETEYDGLNCQFNDLVGLVLDEDVSNITGRIIGYDSASLTVTTDMEIPEALGSGIIFIRKLDGSCAQYTYTRGDSHHLVIDSSFVWNDDYGVTMEYPFFAIGELVKCWVTAVKPEDKKVSLTLVNYDEDIFTDDL